MNNLDVGIILKFLSKIIGGIDTQENSSSSCVYLHIEQFLKYFFILSSKIFCHRWNIFKFIFMKHWNVKCFLFPCLHNMKKVFLFFSPEYLISFLTSVVFIFVQVTLLILHFCSSNLPLFFMNTINKREKH